MTPPIPDTAPSYQQRVNDWIQHCFGPAIGADRMERNHRFLEEALELVQSGGCTASEAHQLVDYVFGRPVGETGQEVGGVMNTLAALCNAHDINLDTEAERELARVWGKSEQIRAKQAVKPKHSPLPVRIPTSVQAALLRRMVEAGGRLSLHALSDDEKGTGVLLAGYARLDGGGRDWGLAITGEGRAALPASGQGEG